MYNETNLNVVYGHTKSFYGKAKVLTNDSIGYKALQSYSTIVAEIKNGIAIVYGAYSNTTMRHIRDFLYQNGFEANIPQKKLLEKYSLKNYEKTMMYGLEV